jgi:hypothetical protein
VSALTDNEFIVRVVVPRLHEEIAQLRRDLGVYEEAMEEILSDACTMVRVDEIASRALDLMRDIDVTPADHGLGFTHMHEDDDGA